MPYIAIERAWQLSRYDNRGQQQTAKNPAELAYVLARECGIYYRSWLGNGAAPSWSLRIEVWKALLAVAQEWYRRIVAPYEDTKLEDDRQVDPWHDLIT